MAKDKAVQDDKQLAPREQQAVESLDPSSIGLPKDALSRLAELGGRDGKAGLFTSDLSVNEFLLVKEAGFNPKGLVFGSSIYHIGLQGRSWSKNRELEKLSQAMYTARELAMSRMEAEAKVLDADGVVGVRLDVNFYDWGPHSAEFIAIGTAIESKDAPMSWRNPLGAPFTSDLSGQDFWTLVQSGYMPLGLVMGTCVYHVGHRNLANVVAQTANNSELVPFTQALYEARELAMTRMQDEAERLGAEGIVGVQMVEKSHFWGSHVIEFFAVGTAIRPIRDNHVIEKPQMMLSLDR
ncbi:MAG: heavy metal-binding domain-containing protein [Actinobacteria bacterium]|nr:heavy metal-binding domain-containing protein [Actinomycetota bacterium]MCL5446840.1 heavy metal-binding domain-containing protein [Actinomycetota bacterium]